MIEEGFDLVIRVNPSPDESLVGRIFLCDRQVVVASPSLPRPVANEPVCAVVRSASDRLTWQLKTADGSEKITVEPVLAL